MVLNSKDAGQTLRVERKCEQHTGTFAKVCRTVIVQFHKVIAGPVDERIHAILEGFGFDLDRDLIIGVLVSVQQEIDSLPRVGKYGLLAKNLEGGIDRQNICR